LPAGPPGVALSITDEQSLKWFGTARARVGWLSPGGSLWYGTGGAAWGRVNQTLTLAATPGIFLGSNSSSASFNNDRLGWTIGAGVETPVWDKLSVKAEYLYVNLGRGTNSFSSPLDPAAQPPAAVITGSSSSIQDHIFRLGLNYHFGGDLVPATPAPVYTKAPAPSGPAWNGFYGGVNAGVAIARNPTVDQILTLPAVPGSFPVAGADSFKQVPFGGLFGAQLGYNWRAAPSWVLGAEVDWQWARQTDTACVSGCLPTGVNGVAGLIPGTLQGLVDSQTLSWFGTARGRFGWVAPSGSLWYVTGGAAWGRVESVVTLVATPAGVFAPGAQIGQSFSETRLGWTVGAGAELPLWDRWSLKAEYLYIDLGSVNNAFASAADAAQGITTFATSSSFSIHDHIARMGVNYHF
jgi:outer membrane immunogenic protein